MAPGCFLGVEGFGPIKPCTIERWQNKRALRGLGPGVMGRDVERGKDRHLRFKQCDRTKDAVIN
jgi:hypothetical protein